MAEIIDFQKNRRELVIKKLIEMNRLAPSEIEKLVSMHDFLIQIDYKMRNDLIDQETFDRIEEEVSFVREKFDDLFEMMKEELFNKGYWRT
jgi:hypothetical protein